MNSTYITLKKQQGVGLVEVLVAALIIAVGLLGIASLQATSLQASIDAETRIKATNLASELTDRIRANLALDNSYMIDQSGATSSLCAVAPTSCSDAPGTTTSGSACNTAQMTQDDLYAVICSASGISNRLPGGTLQVTCADIDTDDADSCTDGSIMEIKIAWLTRKNITDNTTTADDYTDSVTMPFIPGRTL